MQIHKQMLKNRLNPVNILKQNILKLSKAVYHIVDGGIHLFCFGGFSNIKGRSILKLIKLLYFILIIILYTNYYTLGLLKRMQARFWKFFRFIYLLSEIQ